MNFEDTFYDYCNYVWLRLKSNYTIDDVFTFLVYIGAIIAFFIVIQVENQELYNRGGKRNLYKNGEGASYYKGKYRDGDNFKKILQKIRISSRYDVETVYWRRSLLFSIVISFLILAIVLRRFPRGVEFLPAILILYLTLYFFFLYYQKNVSEIASEQVSENIKKLEKMGI